MTIPDTFEEDDQEFTSTEAATRLTSAVQQSAIRKWHVRVVVAFVIVLTAAVGWLSWRTQEIETQRSADVSHLAISNCEAMNESHVELRQAIHAVIDSIRTANASNPKVGNADPSLMKLESILDQGLPIQDCHDLA